MGLIPRDPADGAFVGRWVTPKSRERLLRKYRYLLRAGTFETQHFYFRECLLLFLTRLDERSIRGPRQKLNFRLGRVFRPSKFPERTERTERSFLVLRLIWCKE